MPKLSSVRGPSYCKHRGSGHAVVTLNGRDVYPGAHGTAASKRECPQVKYRNMLVEVDGDTISVLGKYQTAGPMMYGAGQRIKCAEGEGAVIGSSERSGPSDGCRDRSSPDDRGRRRFPPCGIQRAETPE